jgi:hypothetical protein
VKEITPKRLKSPNRKIFIEMVWVHKKYGDILPQQEECLWYCTKEIDEE